MCCISTTKRIYYCECSILLRATICGRERCSSSSSSGSRPSILAQCLASTSLEQYLSSGTVSGFWNNVWVLEQYLILGTLEQQWLNSGHESVTVFVCRNSASLKHYHQWIYVHVHIILQCPLQISNISITKDDDEELLSNKYNSAAQMFQMSIKVECCNKDVEQFFSSFSVGRNFNFYFPFFYKGTPSIWRKCC